MTVRVIKVFIPELSSCLFLNITIQILLIVLFHLGDLPVLSSLQRSIAANALYTVRVDSDRLLAHEAYEHWCANGDKYFGGSQFATLLELDTKKIKPPYLYVLNQVFPSLDRVLISIFSVFFCALSVLRIRQAKIK